MPGHKGLARSTTLIKYWILEWRWDQICSILILEWFDLSNWKYRGPKSPICETAWTKTIIKTIKLYYIKLRLCCAYKIKTKSLFKSSKEVNVIALITKEFGINLIIKIWKVTSLWIS